MNIIQLVQVLPRGRVADVIGRQLLRSGTSVGANYRSACRARSNADFVAKMGLVEEEADKSRYWLELLTELGAVDATRVEPLLRETDEVIAIAVSSIKIARKRRD